MTYHEKIVVSAYTGYLMCDFSDMHEYIEKKLGRTVWAHEMADKDIQEAIRNAVRPDFIALCGHKDGGQNE